MNTEYVVGFQFNEERTKVALIRKSKPEWQKGLLNGVGGKIETRDVNARAAMVREFQEETGVLTDAWMHYARMEGGDWVVECFACTGNLNWLRSAEAEPIEVVDLDGRTLVRKDIIENLPWLITLALDTMEDGRPRFTTAKYP
jgi:8-oxo-dGTP diphosphatase